MNVLRKKSTKVGLAVLLASTLFSIHAFARMGDGYTCCPEANSYCITASGNIWNYYFTSEGPCNPCP
jgi:hypothetical protein